MTVFIAVLAAGYALGRWRPALRASGWAHWQSHRDLRRHSPRWWAVWLIRSTENLAWLAAHPVKGARAWRHRHDPPPPLAPAIRFRNTRQDADPAARRGGERRAVPRDTLRT